MWLTSVNGDWGTYGGQVMSAFYHPTKTHSATTVGKLGQKRSVANKGEWAISIQTKALFGNKAFYNVIDWSYIENKAIFSILI